MNRAFLKLIYNGKDISADIASHVESFSYTDHEGDKADDLQVNLDDSKGLWKGAWFPQKGAILKASIESDFSGTRKQLYCGTFAIDEISASGPPDIVILKAVSSLTAKALKQEKKSRSWENISFSALVDEIAKEHGLSVYYNVDKPIDFTRVDQREESDLGFLNRLANTNDLSLKISDEKIIIFEGKKFEDAAPVFSVTRGKTEVGRYSFDSKTHDVYRGCSVSYWDVGHKEVKTYVYTPPGAPQVGQILKVNQRVESIADAMAKAKSMLRKKNKHEVKATFDLMGDTALLAGLTGTITGWGNFSGKYILGEVRHTQNRSQGYRTNVTLRKVLNY
jgi:hypothetical protein